MRGEWGWKGEGERLWVEVMGRGASGPDGCLGGNIWLAVRIWGREWLGYLRETDRLEQEHAEVILGDRWLRGVRLGV